MGLIRASKDSAGGRHSADDSGSRLRAFLTKHFAEDLIDTGTERVSERAALPPPNCHSARQSGVALFMVLAAVSVLSVLATEFTYVAQVNQKMAFDSLDQLKAHYLAKSGLKLSLLRLKAYAQVKAMVGAMGGGAAGGGGGLGGAIPKQLLEQVWSFPFIFPLPTNLPGMSITDKESIDEFTKSSGLDGSFTAKISSESAKYNLNRILQPFAAEPSPSPGPSSSAGPSPNPSSSPGSPNNTPSGGPSAAPSFSPDAARKNLSDFLSQILQNKFDSDQDFQSQYRDFRMDDFMDGVVSWADHSYQRHLTPDDTWPAIKQMPFNTVSELHMISPMTDDLFDLWSSSLTVSTTPGIDIDTMEETTLKALVPQMTQDEIGKFFAFRDSLDEDNLFKSEDDFYKYLQSNVSYFRTQQVVDQFKTDLAQKGIRLVTEETQFKVTVQAQVQQSVRLLEAWVTLTGPGSGSVNGGAAGAPAPANGKNPAPTPTPAQPGQPVGANGQPVPDSGLIVTFMRIL